MYPLNSFLSRLQEFTKQINKETWYLGLYDRNSERNAASNLSCHVSFKKKKDGERKRWRGRGGRGGRERERKRRRERERS